MKAMERRVFLSKLAEACNESGLELEIESREGSHEALKISNPVTKEKMTLILTSHRHISPGVLREMKKAAVWFGKRITIGVVVREILDKITRHWP